MPLVRCYKRKSHLKLSEYSTPTASFWLYGNPLPAFLLLLIAGMVVKLSIPAKSGYDAFLLRL